MISTVLLCPAPTDPYHLLDASVTGSDPPTMVLCNADERTNGEGTWHIVAPPCREYPRTRALVLARNGQAVPAGVFAAWFQADGIIGADPDPGSGEGLSTALYDGVLELIPWAASLRRDGLPLGTLVLLDADGRCMGGSLAPCPAYISP